MQKNEIPRELERTGKIALSEITETQRVKTYSLTHRDPEFRICNTFFLFSLFPSFFLPPYFFFFIYFHMQFPGILGEKKIPRNAEALLKDNTIEHM